MTDDERFNQIRLHHASGDDCAAFLVRYASAQRARADRLAAALEGLLEHAGLYSQTVGLGEAVADARDALAAPAGGEGASAPRPRYEDCFGVPGHERCFGGCRVPKREPAP